MDTRVINSLEQAVIEGILTSDSEVEYDLLKQKLPADYANSFSLFSPSALNLRAKKHFNTLVTSGLRLHYTAMNSVLFRTQS